jgi:aldose 1-epimerase
MKATCSDFGRAPDGSYVFVFTLENSNGIEARITNYGGILVSLKTPDRNGETADVVLGFDALAGYLAHPDHFFGSLIGRYANRIDQARFSLRGVKYLLDKNDGSNSLHGGSTGFDKRIWAPTYASNCQLELNYLSKDGEGGFPGNLNVTVTYSLTERDDLHIRYVATTDRETAVNLTNHSYFNLSAGESDSILDHRLTIDADRFLPVREDLIPTGEYRPVHGTSFDFRTPMTIGARIENHDQQLKCVGGYDHNWVLNHTSGLSTAARVEEPTTGRVLQVQTTEPGLQFYSGNFLDGTIQGKAGVVYKRRSGFCLEPQHFPDSPNQPAFPSTLLSPGQRFESLTVYRFFTDP